ncbi:MAG: signal recognition particle protein [Oscillospiraceae bacterium]|nr:signal recognition particle protein [Oscillospiraceae bacterium]
MAFENLSEKLSNAFKKLKSKGKLSESDVKEAMKEIKLALLEADVSYKIVKDFIASVSEICIGDEILKSLTPAQHVIKIVNDELTKLMGSTQERINIPSKSPCIIMMCGLQGSGKTTHCAKLANYFKNRGNRPLLVACDIYRPAAIDQLKLLGEKINIPVFSESSNDPVEISSNAVSVAKDHGYDIVIIDTAGRLHIDEKLMDELKDIKQKVLVNETLLVIDSMTGQDAVNIAKTFNELLDIDGVILTKLDGDTRGGAALSVKAITGKPIKFVGLGEKLDALEPFHPDRMASRILGMGDMLTLIEKAEAQLKIDESILSNKKNKKIKEFNLDDLLDQMRSIKKIGSLQQIISMIPGVGGKLKDADIDKGEVELKKIEVIISSMTKKEREKPSIINASRKKRISNGSGTSVQDINRLLRQFEQTQKLIKQFGGKFKRGKGLF